MKYRIWLGRPSSLMLVKRATATLAIAAILTVSVLALDYFRLRGEAEDLRTKASGLQDRIDSSLEVIDRAKGIEDTPSPKGLESVAATRNYLQNVAVEWNCVLQEFHAGAEIAPYLSRFRFDAEQNGWGQIEAQAVIQGTAANVLGALGALKKCDVPLEFNVVEVTRQSVSRTGVAVLAAAIQFRIVTPGVTG